MAQFLGDFFTEKIKDSLSSFDVSLKGILLIKIPEFIQITYEKYAIIIAESTCKKFIGLVAINTDKPKSGNYFTITKDKFGFLRYDSHVDCDFISDRPVDEIRNFLLKNPEHILGEITDFQHVQILEKLTNSRLLTPKQKKLYGFLH